MFAVIPKTTLACECCGEPIGGKPYLDKAVGLVCRECAHDLMDAARALYRAGIIHIFIGSCGDNRDGEDAP